YFDLGRGRYFYRSNGSWRASASLPASIGLGGRDFVTLEMGTDKPYEHHTEVVRHYPPGLTRDKGRGKGKARGN
ncbi:MAG: hypothetical protein ACOCWT_02630, partial [Desulfohalobiaceae bacterium]